MQWCKTEDTVALLDIGASKSNLCIVAKGKPRLVRTFYRGGNGITAAIQETMGTGCSFNDAEQKKISTGILYDETAEDHEQSADISSAIKRGLTPLLTELQQSLHAYEIQQDDSITRLYMAGGGARLLNLDKFLQSALEIEVEPFRVPADILHKLTGREGARFVIPTGMGLALRGAVHKKPAVGLNFRKGESFSKKEGKETTVRLIYMMIAVAAAALLGSTDFYFRYHHREAKYKDIKSEIRRVYMETFPEARNVVDENQQLKSAVDELRKKVAALGGGAGRGMTSLDLLNTITEKIPKDITVNIDDLMMDKTKIRVQGNTDSFENVERIKREFETIPFFKKVEVSDAKLAADQKRVKFRIIVDL